MPRDAPVEQITDNTPGAIFVQGIPGRNGSPSYWRMPTVEESAERSLQAQVDALPPKIKAALAAGQLQPQYSMVDTGGGHNGQKQVANGITGFTSPGPNDTTYTYSLSGETTGSFQNQHGGGGWFDHFIGAISGGLADLDSSLKLSENAPIIAAIGIGILTAGAGTALGTSMMNAGILTSAEAASAAVIASGGTAAAATAAGVAATATAAAVGTAIVSAGVQVAQGKPLDQALGSAVTSLLTSQVISPAIASEVESVISSPLVASTVTNMGTSLASGVLTGKTEDQIVNSVLQAGAGTVVNSVANDIVKNTPGLNDPSIPPEAKKIALAGVIDAITTGDGTKSMVNVAISVGTKAVLNAASDMLHPDVVATLQDTHDTATAAAAAPDQSAANKDASSTRTDAISNDVNTLIGQGVDPNTALSTALDWHAASSNEAVVSGTGPGSLGAQEAVAGGLTDAELAAASGVEQPTPVVTAAGALPTSNEAALTAGSSPGSAEAATQLTSPSALLAAGAGESGSLPTALGNEAVASGMSPGALGAQAAADNSLLPTQEAAAYGTSDVTDLTGATAAEDKLTKSANEAVASGLSPGSVGAAQAAEGMLTGTQLAAASGTNTGALPSVSIPKLTSAAAPATSSATTTGALPTTSYTDQAAIPGKLLKVGQMGTDMTDHKLKQLYESLTGAAAAPAYNYVNDVNPETLNIAQLDTQAYQQPQQPMYAHGGLVHLAEGGQPDEVMSALKSLGAIGFDSKVASPRLLQQGQMGGSYNPKVLPQLAALLQSRGMKLAEGGQPDDHTHPNYDGTPLFRTGGLEGVGGKYVEGKGDGQSDDIPAMLADGEYVFDAQTVADFGNGSNKAGAKMLDAMREAIRAHKRNSPLDSIPPKSKTPEQYLMDARKYLKGVK